MSDDSVVLQPDGTPGAALRLKRMQSAAGVMLSACDPQPDRGGLAETPLRVAKAWDYWSGGHRVDIASLLKTFKDGREREHENDQIIIVRDIPFYSHCEHHLAPFFGHATIGYLPGDCIVGLSKFGRLVDAFARRLQVQERLTTQIAEAIIKHLEPRGVGVIVTARHLCMESRGVKHAGCNTTTSALLGEFRDDPTVRAEFLKLAGGGK